MAEDDHVCEACGRAFDRDEATRTETYADLDATKWQSLCCPDCGRKVETVFVGGDG